MEYMIGADTAVVFVIVALIITNLLLLSKIKGGTLHENGSYHSEHELKLRSAGKSSSLDHIHSRLAWNHKNIRPH